MTYILDVNLCILNSLLYVKTYILRLNREYLISLYSDKQVEKKTQLLDCRYSPEVCLVSPAWLEWTHSSCRWTTPVKGWRRFPFPAFTGEPPGPLGKWNKGGALPSGQSRTPPGTITLHVGQPLQLSSGPHAPPWQPASYTASFLARWWTAKGVHISE